MLSVHIVSHILLKDATDMPHGMQREGGDPIQRTNENFSIWGQIGGEDD